MSTPSENLPAVLESSAVIAPEGVQQLPAAYRAYLNHLTNKRSRDTMEACLDRLAAVAVLLVSHDPDGELDSAALSAVAHDLSGSSVKNFGAQFPWHTLRRDRTVQLAAVLASPELGWAPAYANKHLSALRGVLGECWLGGLMTSEDYERAKKIPNIKAKREPAGRDIHPDEMTALLESSTSFTAPRPAGGLKGAGAVILDILGEHGLLPRAALLAEIRARVPGGFSDTHLTTQLSRLKARGLVHSPEYGFWAATGKQPGTGIPVSNAVRHRDAALFTILECTGMRVTEAITARIEDYDPGSRALKVTGKGNKQRTVPVHKDAAPHLDRWIALVGERRGPLFRAVDRWGKIKAHGITPDAVRLRLNLHRERAGLMPMSPHDFRRTFIGNLAETGTDLMMIRDVVGHEDLNTTGKYDRRRARGIRDAVDRMPIVVPDLGAEDGPGEAPAAG